MKKSDAASRIFILYSCEKDYAPIAHGELQFDAATRVWIVSHPDPCIQRQAQCYLEVHLEQRRPGA
jgi:hypothetical protein